MSCWCNSSHGHKTTIDPPETMYPKECDTCALCSCSQGFYGSQEVVPALDPNKLFKLGRCQPIGRPPQPSRCPNLRSKPGVCFWTVDDVCQWLTSIGYPRYCHFMHANKMDGRKLARMGVHDLRREGMRNFDHCIQIGTAIEELTGRRRYH